MLGLKGLATGIGSLPHKDVHAALDLIFKYCPQIPFWPQLPKRDIKEGMVAQFSENLPCLEVTAKGLVFNSEDKEKKLEDFYKHIIDKDPDYFKINPDYAQGLYAFYNRLSKADLRHIEHVKLQVTGPFTFTASIKDGNGVALLHDPVFRQAFLEGLINKALWQIKLFERFGKSIIVFIDEPYLGCFGSAYTAINREEAVSVLKEFTEKITSAGKVLVGVHCCGNTDWSIFTDIKTIDIISFDAFGFLDRLLLYADNLKEFFGQGRILCWGIVPTQESSGKETPQSLVKVINAGIEILAKKGVSRELLIQNLIISPACGLGTLDASKSQAIFVLLSETSTLLKKLS
jgi:methionine synthase II (cobalamin-independent)